MRLLFALLACFALTITACTDPITVGSDILIGDSAEVGQINDLPFETRVVRDDSILVFDADQSASLGNFSFGRTSDPVFGRWRHEFSVTPALTTISTQFNVEEIVVPEFAEVDRPIVDSVVLIIQLDTTMDIFGAEQDGHRIPAQFLRLAEQERTTADRYSNDERTAVTTENLFDGTEIFATQEPRPLYDSAYATTIPVVPHIRLKLTQSFVDEVNALDTTNFATAEAFREFFPGAYLETTGEADAMINLRPRGNPSLSGFYFFYQDPSPNDTASFYRAPLADWFVRYDHDYTGSVAETLFNQPGSHDTLLVGGTGSVMTAITFPDRAALASTLINRAELTYFRTSVADYSYDDFPSSSFLGLYYRDSEGALVNILDRVTLGQNPSNDLLNQFLGGFPEMEGDDTVFYRTLISRHLQGIIESDFVEPTVYLRTVPLTSDPSRVILNGPGAGSRPANLTVTFTRSE